jgi:hypothetical protein
MVLSKLTEVKKELKMYSNLDLLSIRGIEYS